MSALLRVSTRFLCSFSVFSSFKRYLLFLDKNILWRTFTPRRWNSLHLRWIWLFWCSWQGWQMDPDFHGKRRHDNPPCWHISPIYTGWERMLLQITVNFDDKSMWVYITLVTTCPETCNSLAKHIKYEVGIWKTLNNSQHLNLSSPGHKSSFLSSAVTASHCHVISVAYFMWQRCESQVLWLSLPQLPLLLVEVQMV